MSEPQERMFYEVMWRNFVRGHPLPAPWWVQQSMRRWIDDFDEGLFPSKESAFASNALFRYWNMVGVKNAPQECLIGPAGEVEPVYDEYTLSFFLFEPGSRRVHFPQHPDFMLASPPLTHRWQDGYLPILETDYVSPIGVSVHQRVSATTVGIDQKSMGLMRLEVRGASAGHPVQLGISVSAAGPTGFRRHDRARSFVAPRWLNFLRYHADESRLDVNQHLGAVFDMPPDQFGMYGNGETNDPDFYLRVNAYEELRSRGVMNGFSQATDYIGGMCHGVLLWDVPPTGAPFTLDIRLPIDDFKGPGDLGVLRGDSADALEQNNHRYWDQRLNHTGLQARLPDSVSHLFDLFRTCRATILMLADDGAIHPGPTIYDSFWIRDSSVEAVACTMAGDADLAERQFADHYTHPTIFHMDDRSVGPVSVRGFFGGEHELNDREWDSNGEALWAFGRFDRLSGPAAAFGARVFTPYVVEGARWIGRNRSDFGLLHSGWSAEHVGDKDKPHYWDDFWALAGLWEAAQLAERLQAPHTRELWGIYDDVRRATRDSILWVLDQQRALGRWETFIPTGPADVNRLDSTIIGTAAYFHPCRLYMGQKLGPDVDLAARQTLDTIWAHFVDGGFRHDSSWRCYGPYLTLQLAHAFLLIGALDRMDHLLAWSVGNAGFPTVSDASGGQHFWHIAQGAWNEQHNYSIAKNFTESASTWWYMGDIPHGWAAAELIALVRDILFFEADEDREPTIFVAPGLMPQWIRGAGTWGVRDAPTVFGTPFGYRLQHAPSTKELTLTIDQPAPPHVRYVWPVRLGRVVSAVADGTPVPVADDSVLFPPATSTVIVRYA